MADPVRRFFTIYLPSEYRDRVNVVQKGVAKTGEVSEKGATTQIDHWDGRRSAIQQPATIHWTYDLRTGKFRPKTRQELIEQGYLVPGQGPRGIERKKTGIHIASLHG